MIYWIIFFAFGVACVLGAPTDVASLDKQQPTVIPIVSQSEELELNGTYKFSYETGNGIKREETSYDKVLPKASGRSHSSEEGGNSSESDESNEIHVQQGSYSYTAPDGTLITVRYIADENGFRPVGSHLPKPPSPISSTFSAKTGRTLKQPDHTSSESAQTVNVNSEQSVPAVASRSAAESVLAEEKQAETTSVASSNGEEPQTTPAVLSPVKTQEIVTTTASQTEPKTEATESPILPSTQANENSESETGSGSTPVASELSEGTLKQSDSTSSESPQPVNVKSTSETVPAVTSSLAAEPKAAEDEPAENTLGTTSKDEEPEAIATTLPSAKSSDITTTSYQSEPRTEATESTVTSTQSDEISEPGSTSGSVESETKADSDSDLEEKMELSTQAATEEEPSVTTESTQTVPDASNEASATTLSDSITTEADILTTTATLDNDETTNSARTDALIEEVTDMPSSTEASSNEEVSTSSS